jgi:hypothetical protein
MLCYAALCYSVSLIPSYIPKGLNSPLAYTKTSTVYLIIRL